jgi:hypothetical protein
VIAAGSKLSSARQDERRPLGRAAPRRLSGLRREGNPLPAADMPEPAKGSPHAKAQRAKWAPCGTMRGMRPVSFRPLRDGGAQTGGDLELSVGQGGSQKAYSAGSACSLATRGARRIPSRRSAAPAYGSPAGDFHQPVHARGEHDRESECDQEMCSVVSRSGKIVRRQLAVEDDVGVTK